MSDALGPSDDLTLSTREIIAATVKQLPLLAPMVVLARRTGKLYPFSERTMWAPLYLEWMAQR